MKINRSLLFIIITLILSAYIFFTLLIYVKRTAVPPVKEDRAEAAKEPRIYEIPENRIPPAEKIEEQIEKRQERRKEKDAVIKQKTTRVSPRYPERETAPAEKEKSPGAKTGAVPDKKEVRFPTYEERKAARSSGSIHVY